MKLPRGIKNSQKHLSRMLNDNIKPAPPVQESHSNAGWYITFVAVVIISFLIVYISKDKIDANSTIVSVSESVSTDLHEQKSKTITDKVDGEGSLDALIVSANNLYDSQQYEDALDLYTKIIHQQPSNAEMYRMRGNTYYFLGDYNSALNDYFKSIKIDSDQADIFSNIGHIYTLLKDYEKAILNCNEALNLDPESIFGYFNRAQAYEAIADSVKAMLDYNKVIELDATHESAYYYRGYIQYGYGLYASAASDFAMAIDLDPENLDSYLMKGAAEALSGKFDKSISTLTLLIQKSENPTDIVDAYYYRANVYYTNENYTNAISDYTNALNVDLESHDPNLYLYRSDAYDKIGNTYMANLDMERYNELVAE